MKRLAILALILLLFLSEACVTAVTPRQPAASDTWCVYTVKAARGGGAIAVGSSMCIYCPPGTSRCPATLTVRPAEGIEYDLTNTSITCTTPCPGAQTYQR